MADIKRINVGNTKYPGIDQNVLPQEQVLFEFSTNEITFDQNDRTFDENDTPGL